MTPAPRNASPCVSIASFRSDALAVDGDVAESLVLRRSGSVVGIGRRGEPALVDAAAVGAEGVEIARVQLQPASGHQKRSGNPAGRQPDKPVTGGEGVFDQLCIGHRTFAAHAITARAGF